MFEIVVDTPVENHQPEFGVRVAVRRRELNDYGLVCDFHEIRRSVQALLQRFDPSEESFLADSTEHLQLLYARRPFTIHSVEIVFPES